MPGKTLGCESMTSTNLTQLSATANLSVCVHVTQHAFDVDSFQFRFASIENTVCEGEENIYVCGIGGEPRDTRMDSHYYALVFLLNGSQPPPIPFLCSCSLPLTW